MAVVLSLAACDGGAPKFRNIDITGADYAKGFALTDHTGKPRTLADFRGKVVVVFFGYTRCPDVCPATLVEIKDVMQKLGPDAEKVQVVFITVDPGRDTPESIQEYVANFDSSFLGLSGTEAELSAVWQAYGVFREIEQTDSVAGYLVAHTSRVYVVDVNGNLSLSFAFGTSPDDVANDLRILLK